MTGTAYAVRSKGVGSCTSPAVGCGNAIYRGITTGLNDAFIIDNQTKDALIAKDPRSADIIKPVVRGRDIRRFQAQWAGFWLIDSHNGYGNVPAIDINDYPAIKAHLDGFYDRLAKRYDKGSTPYNLRNCAYHEDFKKEKLFWMDMTPRGRFSYSNDEIYCNDKGFMMTGVSLKYLCAVLNSSLIAWLMKNEALTTGMGLPQWKKFAVERISVPSASSTQQQVFIQMIDHILRAKAEDQASDTSETEAEIDEGVYQVYGLTPLEISAVEENL